MDSKPIPTQTSETPAKHHKIIHLYQDIIETDPNQPLWIYRQLADLLIQQQAIDPAIQILQQAIHLYPNTAGGYISLGSAFNKKGDLETALKNYRIATSLDPKPPAWLKQLIQQDQTDIIQLEGINLFINSNAISPHLQNLIRLGRYETQEIKILKQILQPTDNIIELGGGIGFLSIYTKTQFPQLQISTYEANPHLIEILQKNQQLNHCHFPVHNTILDNQATEIDFFLAEDFWASSTIPDHPDTQPIKIKTQDINQAITQQNANFLIIDIEGGEANLIPKINLNPIKKILIEIHPQIIGNPGLSKIFLTLLNNNFIYDSTTSMGQVYYFYKET